MTEPQRLIAPHQRELLADFFGDQGEDGFYTKCRHVRLVRLLAVPVLPEDFHLDLAERLALWNSSKGQDGQTSPDQASRGQLEQGRIKGRPTTDDRSTKRKFVDDGQYSLTDQRPQQSLKRNPSLLGPSRALGLLELPSELLDCIFDYLDRREVITLGLLTRRLWKLARRHLRPYCMPVPGRWAGKAIICIGA